jgi:hypothetical protein
MARLRNLIGMMGPQGRCGLHSVLLHQRQHNEPENIRSALHPTASYARLIFALACSLGCPLAFIGKPRHEHSGESNAGSEPCQATGSLSRLPPTGTYRAPAVVQCFLH